jgi:hypothetical protein
VTSSGFVEGKYRFHLQVRRIRQARNQQEAGGKDVGFTEMYGVTTQKILLFVILSSYLTLQPFVSLGLLDNSLPTIPVLGVLPPSCHF